MEKGPYGNRKGMEMKKMLMFGAVGCITTAILDPLLYSSMNWPIPWFRDAVLAVAGVACFYFLLKFRDDF
jgi:hypothetical protein